MLNSDELKCKATAAQFLPEHTTAAADDRHPYYNMMKRSNN